MRIATAVTMLLVACVAHAGEFRADVPPGVTRVPPERLANFWLLVPESAQANVPNSGYGLNAPTSVAVSYVIGSSGATRDVKLERVVPPGLLGKVAFNVVRGMRFAPAPTNIGKEAVLTYVVMPFNLPDADSQRPGEREARARALAPCQLADFPTPAK
jgi:hypothetical protein